MKFNPEIRWTSGSWDSACAIRLQTNLASVRAADLRGRSQQQIRRIVIRGLKWRQIPDDPARGDFANVDSSSRPAPSNQQPYIHLYLKSGRTGPALVRLTGLMAIFPACHAFNRQSSSLASAVQTDR